MEDQLRRYADKLAYEIDAWDLKVALERGERITVIDARSADAYATGHIPGAINIPHRTMSEETTAAVDRASTVVTYCDGIGCNASSKGALNMTKIAFKVKELIGGLDWGKRDGYLTTSAVSTASTGVSCGCQ